MKSVFTLIILLLMATPQVNSQTPDVYKVYKVVKGIWNEKIKDFKTDTLTANFDLRLNGDRIYVFDEPRRVFIISKSKDDYEDQKLVVRSYRALDENHDRNVIYIGYNKIKNETSMVVIQHTKGEMTRYYYRKQSFEQIQ